MPHDNITGYLLSSLLFYLGYEWKLVFSATLLVLIWSNHKYHLCQILMCIYLFKTLCYNTIDYSDKCCRKANWSTHNLSSIQASRKDLIKLGAHYKDLALQKNKLSLWTSGEMLISTLPSFPLSEFKQAWNSVLLSTVYFGTCFYEDIHSKYCHQMPF